MKGLFQCPLGNRKGELCFLGWAACIRCHRHRDDACTGKYCHYAKCECFDRESNTVVYGFYSTVYGNQCFQYVLWIL